MTEQPDYDELYKVVLVGDPSVGKTNLLAYFAAEQKDRESANGVAKTFNEVRKPTIGVEFGTQTIVHPNGTRIKAQIWDTAGQERYRAITNSHYRRAAGALLVYDISNPKTFENAKKHWFNELKHAAAEMSTLMSCITLVGNKTDLMDENAVSVEEHEELTSALNIASCRTSAKSGENVSRAFEELILRIYNTDKARAEPVKRPSTVKLNQKKPKNDTTSSCCN